MTGAAGASMAWYGAEFLQSPVEKAAQLSCMPLRQESTTSVLTTAQFASPLVKLRRIGSTAMVRSQMVTQVVRAWDWERQLSCAPSSDRDGAGVEYGLGGHAQQISGQDRQVGVGVVIDVQAGWRHSECHLHHRNMNTFRLLLGRQPCQ